VPSDSTRQNYTGTNYQTQIAPKLNLIYTATDNLKLFLDAGRGFHSNDARAVVQDKSHTLPSAWSAEIGTQWSPVHNVYFSAAFWGMTLENELFFNGDDGTTVDNGASRRIGVDLSARAQLTPQFFLDADLNLSQGRLVETPFGKPVPDHYYIALAPPATSTGGLSYRSEHWEGAFRYRYVSPRSANDDNTVVAHGYFINDANIYYKTKKLRIGFNIENLFNVIWNEAQFDTLTQLKGEKAPVDELHFSAGTPLSIKLIVGFRF
jgi:outer membrane receptor protein involved in Fe transport